MSRVDKQRYVSLREVGRQLGVPPSTIVFYRDKFSKYIPSCGGGGRQRRYPAEAVEIFGRIRQMYGNNWSTEQIEQELALKFSALLGERVESVQLNSCGGADGAQLVNAVLDKVTDVLQNQDLFRGEIRSLRDEMSGLRRARSSRAEEALERVERLEKELKDLRRENEQLQRLIRMGGVAGEGPQFPSEAFLGRPLVVRTEAGEFLGVNGRAGGHFALKDFVALVERGVASGRNVTLKWEPKDGCWVLLVSSWEGRGGDEQRIVLVTRKTVTPSKNVVTEILRMNINGKDVPDVLMLSLFKQIRDGFGL